MATAKTNGHTNGTNGHSANGDMAGLRSIDQLDPGLPHDSPCLSFWLGQQRQSKLLGLRTTPDVPEETEVAIIGSGLSGAATAYFLLTGHNPPASVTLLESREICHGATGRNGGHCRPDCFRGYTGYRAAVGKEQALKIMANEMDTFKLLAEIIKKEGLADKCDYWSGLTYDLALDEGCAKNFKDTLEEFRKDGGPIDIVEWIDAEEAKIATRTPDARGAAIFPAASFWPYKFVCAILDICLKKGLNIQTNTPVNKVLASQDGQGGILETPRGQIKAKKIVHATNAYAGHILPEFQVLISPFRGQCSQITPTKAYSGSKMLTHTYSFRWKDVRNDFDYMMQRPADGSIIIGGGRWKTDIKKLINQTDDSVLVPELSEHFVDCMPKYFSKDWGKEEHGEGLTRVWAGIMGYTHEAIPYVGELEQRPGQYIIAGHSGHGMARIMSCSRGIAQLIQGEDFAATGLPECFQPTTERMQRYDFTVQKMWADHEGVIPGTDGMVN